LIRIESTMTSQPGHPSWVDTVSTGKQAHHACTSTVSQHTAAWCLAESGLQKQRSVSPYTHVA